MNLSLKMREWLIWGTFAVISLPLLFLSSLQLQSTVAAKQELVNQQQALPLRQDFYDLAYDISTYRADLHLRPDDSEHLETTYNNLKHRINRVTFGPDEFPSTRVEWEQWKASYVDELRQPKIGVFLAALDELISIAELYTKESNILASLSGDERLLPILYAQVSRVQERVAQVRGIAVVEESELKAVFMETMRWTIRHQLRFISAEMDTYADDSQRDTLSALRSDIEELLNLKDVDPQTFYQRATHVLSDLAQFRQAIGLRFDALLQGKLEQTGQQLAGLLVMTCAAFLIAALFSFWLVRVFRRQEALALELSEKEHLYRIAVDNAEVGIIDRPDIENESEMYWSPRVYELLKLPPESETSTLLTRVHPDYRQIMQKLRDQLYQGPGTQQFQAPLLCGDGQYRWFSFNSVSTLNPTTGKLRLSGSIINIDHVRQVEALRTHEAELARTVKQLSQANSDLERFAHMASHDLQEPLRMVTSFMTLLQEEYAPKLDEDANQYIDYACDGATRMQRLIDDLLEYAHFSSQTAEVIEVDLQEVVEQIRAEQSVRIVETGGQIIAQDLPIIMADRVGLSSVLSNLISNALKYCRPGIPPMVTIELTQTQESQTLVVRDNGIGIASEHFNDIFQPFRRLHGPTEFSGTGVGLALVKNVISSWQGEISVNSEPGAGTTFTIKWPKPEPAFLRGVA